MECPNCANSVSADSPSCPRCGHGLKGLPALSPPPALPAADQIEITAGSRGSTMPPGRPALGTDSTSPRPKRGGKAPLLVAIAVGAILLGSATALVLPHVTANGTKAPPAASAASADVPTPSGTDDAYIAQARAVAELLAAGETAHEALPDALYTCDDLSAASGAFQQLVQDRQQELTQAESLATGQLPDGETLRSALVDVYQNSLTADQAYVAWIQEESDCGSANAPHTQDFRDAASADDDAADAKRRFVALWNPIAQDTGLRQYTWRDL